MTTLAATEQPSLIRLHYLWYVAAAFALMIVAIVSRNLWFLNWVHVFTGLMWTGIDLFMGFILGPPLSGILSYLGTEHATAERRQTVVTSALIFVGGRMSGRFLD